jgi:hypothetical protein
MFDLSHVPPATALPVFALAFGSIALFALGGHLFKYLRGKDVIVAPRRTDLGERQFQDDAEEWRLGKAIFANHCPDCGEQENFYQGPQRGLAVQLYCANPKCRHGFEVSNYGNGIVWAERVENGPDQFYR